MRRRRVESSKFCPPVAPVETTRIVNGPLSTADRVEFEDRIVKHFGFRAVSSKARSAYGSAVDIFPVQTGLAVSDYSQKVLRIEENGIVGLKILKI